MTIPTRNFYPLKKRFWEQERESFFTTNGPWGTLFTRRQFPSFEITFILTSLLSSPFAGLLFESETHWTLLARLMLPEALAAPRDEADLRADLRTMVVVVWVVEAMPSGTTRGFGTMEGGRGMKWWKPSRPPRSLWKLQRLLWKSSRPFSSSWGDTGDVWWTESCCSWC